MVVVRCPLLSRHSVIRRNSDGMTERGRNRSRSLCSPVGPEPHDSVRGAESTKLRNEIRPAELDRSLLAVTDTHSSHPASG